MDDLVGLFTATAHGMAPLDCLNARIDKKNQYKKRAKGLDATQKLWSSPPPQ